MWRPPTPCVRNMRLCRVALHSAVHTRHTTSAVRCWPMQYPPVSSYLRRTGPASPGRRGCCTAPLGCQLLAPSRPQVGQTHIHQRNTMTVAAVCRHPWQQSLWLRRWLGSSQSKHPGMSVFLRHTHMGLVLSTIPQTWHEINLGTCTNYMYVYICLYVYNYTCISIECLITKDGAVCVVMYWPGQRAW